jgi:LysM repeat protein
MNQKHALRTLILFLLVGFLVIGLTSCKLPASKGPQTTSESGGGFPVPGETQQTSGGIDVNTFATQTAQVGMPIVATSTLPSQNPAQLTTVPVATGAPGTPEPTATAVVYVQATPGGLPETYILQEGEFPFCIARRFDVNQTELLNLNNLTPQSFVYAGQELKIPQTGNPFDGERTLQPHPTTYKIQDGDTLYTIACYYGDVSPEMIALQNNLSTYDLPVGEVLIIP